MARTYLTTNNSRGNPVTAMSPTFVHFRGWNAGVYVMAILRKNEPDKFAIYMSNGSNGGAGQDVFLGLIIDTPEGPKWEPR